MRDTEVVVDQLTIAHLDEEWDIPCEVSSHEVKGTGPAAWVMWFSCCPLRGAFILACDGCKEHKLNYPIIRCLGRDGGCGEVYIPGSKAYRLIEPLSRS